LKERVTYCMPPGPPPAYQQRAFAFVVGNIGVSAAGEEETRHRSRSNHGRCVHRTWGEKVERVRVARGMHLIWRASSRCSICFSSRAYHSA
jgi:hypothetical protein